MAGRWIGLGCMRLSTDPARDGARGVAVIQAALDAGVRLLDTADAYALDDRETGHNERLVAEALRSWSGDRAKVRVATKGGLRRPGGRWVPDGRAKHLRHACEASLTALGVATLDVYQLHVIDPRTPLETSVRALAGLQAEGLVRAIGLCNVTVGQIERARQIADIASVQVSLGVHDVENLRNGVAEYCRDHGIELIAYRPLGGVERAAKLGRIDVLAQLATKHGISPQEAALAWLLDLDACVVPIPGATRIETAQSAGRVVALKLTGEDRALLEARYPAGRLLRVPQSRRRPADDANGEVVLVMGMPAAGKSRIAQSFVERGYERLNRDERGGRVSALVSALDAGLAQGRRRWVFDNTYPSRSSRNEVIECAWRHGVRVRCVALTTSLADAQVNAVRRMIEIHGSLPSPETFRSMGRADPRCFGPDAQFRWERQAEPPVIEEGFSAIDEQPFVRRGDPDFEGRALFIEFDDVLCTSRRGARVVLDPDDIVLQDGVRERLASWVEQGWRLCGLAWRPQIAAGEVDEQTVRASFERTRELLGLAIDIAFCPHPAGPPICWCRKPLPGLVLEFALRERTDPGRSRVIGRAAADRTLAQRLGMEFHDAAAFFDRP